MTFPGKIVTFYSYKGGVGRTMALANVAYLAAANDKRVLVIDWDLEAPGLPYYFRGLTKLDLFKQSKDAPGIMDMAWQWVRRTQEATTVEDVDAAVAFLSSDEFFDSLPYRVVDEDQNLTLDLIAAGGSWIKEHYGIAYETALADFSWREFFEEHAGGILLTRFREWAKSRYDLILIDSRTGVADDAGICTIQMPDSVLLCFAMNRQNIDGVARMASVIRSSRRSEIDIHVAPMRVTRAGTAEEADAFSRARRELIRIGGLSPDLVTHQLEHLAVAATVVPFYETLAPVIASTPELDPLTLNYLALAAGITGYDLAIPDFDERWLSDVRHRLQPQHATVAYVDGLLTADPERAYFDLKGYLESARADEIDGADLDPEYVATLVRIVLAISERLESFESLELLGSAVALLRDLIALAPDTWRLMFVACLERYIQFFGLTGYDQDEELSLLDELESTLSQLEQTSVVAMQRISGRRRYARLQHQIGGSEAALAVEELFGLIGDARALFPDSQLVMQDLVVPEVDGRMLRGEIAEANGDPNAAIDEYVSGLEIARLGMATEKRVELQRLTLEITMRLALLYSPEDALKFIIEADFSVSLPAVSHAYSQIVPLTQHILEADVDPDVLNRYVHKIIGDRMNRVQGGALQFVGRTPRSFVEFLRTAVQIAGRLSDLPDQDTQMSIRYLNDAIYVGLRNLANRRTRVSQLPQKEDRTLSEIFFEWQQVSARFLGPEDIDRLNSAFALLNRNVTRL